MKRLKSKLKYKLERYRWLKILFSPFKPFEISWYVGKTAVGTPYFLPRKWVKATNRRATIAALDEIKRSENFNKVNPNSKFKHDVKPFEELFQKYMEHKHAVPLKVGFSSCSLGWKTKWTSNDFRYEWGPTFTFVFFGYQIAAMVGFKDRDALHAYWEAWLCYEYATDKTKSRRERIAECRKIMPQKWTRFHKDGTKETIDYYERILKPKYLK